MKLKNYLFMSHSFRIAAARPRIHGGFAVMMYDVIVTPNLDEISVTRAIFSKAPRKFRTVI